MKIVKGRTYRAARNRELTRKVTGFRECEVCELVQYTNQDGKRLECSFSNFRAWARAKAY